MRCHLAIQFLLIACGDNQRPLCEGGLGANRVDVVIGGTPILLVYRDASNSWIEAAQDQEGTPFLCVDDDYVVTAVCGKPDGSVFTRQTYATVEDGPETTVGICGPSTDPVPELITISGAMTEPGAVWIGGRGLINTASSWTFELAARPGPQVVVLTNEHHPLTPGRFLIKREDFLGDTDLGTFDLSLKGQTTVERPLEVTNVDAEDLVLNQVWAYLGGTTARLNRMAGTVAQELPAESLLEGDFQEVEVVAHSEDETRQFVRIASTFGETSTFDMLPRLTEIAYVSSGRIAVWPELPERFSRIQFRSESGGDGSNEQFVFMSKRYLDRFGVVELALDATPPGFDPAWLPVEPLRQTFTVVDETTDVHYRTTVIGPP